jgi:hypothetical protein
MVESNVIVEIKFVNTLAEIHIHKSLNINVFQCNRLKRWHSALDQLSSALHEKTLFSEKKNATRRRFHQFCWFSIFLNDGIQPI